MTYPPIHNTLPLWQLLQWMFNPLAFLDRCHHQYGDWFQPRLGNYKELILISDPTAIAEIFNHPDQYQSGLANALLRPTLGDHSLLLLDGERHQRQRQLLMPPFHGERMRAYGELICHVTQQVTQSWQVGQTIIIRPAMQEISLRVIMQAVFGLSSGERAVTLQQNLDRLLQVTTSRVGLFLLFFPALQRNWGPWSPYGRFLKLRQDIDDLLYAEIRDRRHRDPDSGRSDILSLLLAARDEAGQPMSDVELRDELITLLIAGHETTATAISWALYWIHRSPEVKANLLQELQALAPQADSTVIARLPYLSAVCAETLRINPVAFVVAPRIAQQSVHISGYTLPAGVSLTPCIYLTHRRPDLYPDPDQFRPERFLTRQFSPTEYFPFGGSNRRCIGAAFALFEMKLVLFTILTQHRLTLTCDRPIRSVRRGITLAPEGGVAMKLVE